MPESLERSSGMTSPSPISPAHPLRTPNNVSPAMSARRPMARIAALRPGASPPPVRTAILCPTLAYLSAELVTDSGVTQERLLLGAAEYDGDTARDGGRRGSRRRCRRGSRCGLGGPADAEEAGQPLCCGSGVRGGPGVPPDPKEAAQPLRCGGVLPVAVVDHLRGRALRDFEADRRREPCHVHQRRPTSARAVIAPAAID